MLTATARGPTRAGEFVLRGVAGSLGFFGLLRLPWTEAHAVLPLTRLQGRLAAGLFGPPASPVDVTLACSGADALALCLGAVLAYPVPWRRRLAGAAGGVALILGLNTLRIGTLGRVAASPAWFNALHVYIWPAVLTLAIAGYVFGWMRLADRSADRLPVTGRIHLSRRFIVLTVAFLILFSAASPLYLGSPAVLALAGFIAGAAAMTLGAAGVSAHAAGNVLWTSRGGFLVTQECISTPLIPVYLAAVCAYSTTWRRLIPGVLATVPLFISLGIVRLLVVALPDVVSPIFFVHAFYQLLLAAVVVFVAARWRHGGPTALRHALAGVIAGLLAVQFLGPLYTGAITSLAGAPLGDPQRAIAILPSFQVGLYLALWVAASGAAGWSRVLAGLAVLGLMQVAGLLALHAGFTAHVRDVRAWAVAGPVLIFAAVVSGARLPRAAYRDFWAGVGERFPDLGGAVSTGYYADNERRLFAEHFPALSGLRILKTDLWDEAKNTRILAWASRQGAHAFGIDISAPTVTQARAAFETGPGARNHLQGAIGDVRAIPFRDDSFDAIYSMGTIEHFAETERAVAEMARVLKPGGRAIVGVPNRHDPFLRPLFATALQAVGLYGYGYEKSYSRRALREMLERAGLEVVAETAILFIPGWLRMLDLACHSWCRPLAALTGALVRPFVFLDRHVPAVRRHGYLLATVVTKPDATSGQ